MTTQCDHDKDKVPSLGGSWVKVKNGGRTKIVCGRCEKLYGYVCDTKRGVATVESEAARG